MADPLNVLLPRFLAVLCHEDAKLSEAHDKVVLQFENVDRSGVLMIQDCFHSRVAEVDSI